MKLRPFQKRFVRQAFKDTIDTAALSLARGNGKSFLAGHLLARALTPGDELHQAGFSALRHSGSMALLSRWKNRRAGRIG